ncbi:MAG: hypothetical protein HY842_16580 [Bacteroidetes bacterium]|nr:hypothetical protein [Bacteroidota bacterium]
MKYLAAIGLVAVSVVFFSCKNEGLRSYYYPLDDLETGKVYEYGPLADELDPPVYWHYKSVTEGGIRYLLGTSYGPQFSPDQFVREEEVPNGMLLTDFYLYEMDSTGESQKIQGEIEAANVFPFTVSQPPGVLLTSLHWRPLGDSSSITLVRNRQYDRDTTYVFNGKTLPAVKFNTRELVDQEEVGHLELEFGGMEIYAEGLGLVYFRKDISNERRIEYELKAVYGVEEFEQKFKAKLLADDEL